MIMTQSKKQTKHHPRMPTAAIQAGTPHPDATLLGACAEFTALQVTPSPDTTRRDWLFEQILASPAEAVEGHRARIKAIECRYPDGAFPDAVEKVLEADWRHIPAAERSQEYRERTLARIEAEMHPPLTVEQVLKRAVDKARCRAGELIDAIKLLDALGGDGEEQAIDGDALKWLASRFEAVADDIMTDLDHAQRAIEGEVYRGANVRFSSAA